jgi:hypothetical protein
MVENAAECIPDCVFSYPQPDGGLLKAKTCTVRVCTHQQSRVESNPVQSDSQRRGRPYVAYLQWQPLWCVHTSRVKSSHTSLDATRSIFVSQTLVIGRDGCYLEEEMDAEKLILLVKDHEAIYDASHCEHGNRFL